MKLEELRWLECRDFSQSYTVHCVFKKGSRNYNIMYACESKPVKQSTTYKTMPIQQIYKARQSNQGQTPIIARFITKPCANRLS